MTLLTIVAAVWTSGAAAASPNDGTDDLRLDTVIVTARKRDELAQQVPLTVSVLTRRLLDQAQVRDGFDLAALTPGFSYESVGSFANAKPVIRGLTTASTVPSQQKSSAFIDGLFVGGTTSPPPFIDLQRVEVLKGPQSAALGRATFAGAVNYITREPSRELTGELDLSGASEDDRELGFSLSAPLTSAIRGRVTAYARDTDGNHDWTNADGRQMGWEKTRYGALRIAADLSESSELKARYSHLHVQDGPVATQFIDPTQRDTLFVRSEDTVSTSGAPKAPSFTFFPTGRVDSSWRERDQDFELISQPGTDVTRENANLELNTSVGAHTLTLLAGMAKEDTFDWQTDGSNLRCWEPVSQGQPIRGTGVCAAAVQTYRNREAEVRLASPVDARVQYLFGASYLEYESTWFGYQPETGSAFFTVPRDDVKSRSAYTAWSTDLMSLLRVGLEARYTTDDLVTTGYSACLFPASSIVPLTPCSLPINGVSTPIGNPFTGEPLGGTEVLRKEFGKLTYRMTLDYRLNDQAMLYAIYSVGNQPGRFNAGLPPAFDSIRSLREEDLQNVEIGLKSQDEDGRLLFNAAVYRMHWTNQVFRRTIALDNPGGPAILQAALINGGDSRITGAEIEAGARVTREIELRATLAYTHAVFENFCSDFYYQLTGIDTSPDGRGRCRHVDGHLLEAQPEWTGSFAAQYERSLGIGEWTGFARADYAYIGRKFESEMNLAWTPPADTVNLRFGVNSSRWRVEAFVLNATDDRTPERIARLTDPSLPTIAPGSTAAGPLTPGVTNLQSIAVTPRKPRQFGLRLQYRFGSLRD